jgi:predicted dehydrogenase
MLREVRPDVVSIGTYVGLHCRLVCDAARAGARAILCEKPFLASVPEFERVRRVAEETGAKIIVAHVRRYRPAFRRARELFNDGTIGQPILCASGIADWDLSEWGSHWLDMFRFLNHDRDVKWVFGQARVRDFRGYGHAMEEHAAAYFEFDNGVRGLLDGGRGFNGGGDMTLVGTGGTIHIANETELTITNASGRRTETCGEATAAGWEACWSAALEDLVNWLEGGPEPMLALPNMLKTAELNLAAYLSAIRADRVDLPMSDEGTEWPVEELQRRWRAREA